MKTLLSVAALLITLVACGQDDGPTVAADPPDTQREVTPPSTVPAAPGPVHSRSLPTVMGTGDGPELCLGAIAESYPPQCSGPPIVGWDWAARAPGFDKQGATRWGTFAVTGTWDGTTFTVQDAIPAALYDPAMPSPVELPTPSVELEPAALQALASRVHEELPGVLSTTPDQAGHVLVDVVYDDGTLQTYADAAYGAGVVVVNGALLDA
jgi:hypothetical protein